MPATMQFNKVSSPRSARSAGDIRAFGLPLRSKHSLEPPFADWELPSPPPPLRDGVTEVHYSRWVVEEANKDVGDSMRQEHQSGKSFRKSQTEKFISDQHRKVEDSHHQMASASAAVENIRLHNLEVGQKMRLNLLEHARSVQLEKQVHSAKGRELVERAKNFQSTKVLERQLQHRGKRQEMGAETKKERQRLQDAREENEKTEEERKRDIADRIKAETTKDEVGRSKQMLFDEKSSIGAEMRKEEEKAIEERRKARENFLRQMARHKLEVREIKAGARSARTGLQSARRLAADEVRRKREAEKERKKALAESQRQRNREIHDMLYAAKFAPRERATKVNLPGRVGKTAFNAYDAEAAAADAASAPAAADLSGQAGGLGGLPPGSPGIAGRRQSLSPGAHGAMPGGGWDDN